MAIEPTRYLIGGSKPRCRKEESHVSKGLALRIGKSRCDVEATNLSSSGRCTLQHVDQSELHMLSARVANTASCLRQPIKTFFHLAFSGICIL